MKREGRHEGGAPKSAGQADDTTQVSRRVAVKRSPKRARHEARIHLQLAAPTPPDTLATPADIEPIVAFLRDLPPADLRAIEEANTLGPRIPKLTGPGPITVGHLHDVLDLIEANFPSGGAA